MLKPQQIQKVWQLHCQTDAHSLNLNSKEFIWKRVAAILGNAKRKSKKGQINSVAPA